MTNFEKIKMMTIKEFSDTFCDNLHTGCSSCKFYFECFTGKLGCGIKNWLESEANPDSDGEEKI